MATPVPMITASSRWLFLGPADAGEKAKGINSAAVRNMFNVFFMICLLTLNGFEQKYHFFVLLYVIDTIKKNLFKKNLKNGILIAYLCEKKL